MAAQDWAGRQGKDSHMSAGNPVRPLILYSKTGNTWLTCWADIYFALNTVTRRATGWRQVYLT